MEPVNLTRSDSEEGQRSAKRQRRSSFDDEVQVVDRPQPAVPVSQVPEQPLGDGDLLITRATGPVWNHDLPHSRSQCGKHIFVPTPSASNQQHCSKCFCYVCDVEAQNCLLWGSGHNAINHCNAHGGSQLYRDMPALTIATAAVLFNPPPAPQAALLPAAAAPVRPNPPPATAAGPSGGSPAALSRQSNEPSQAVVGPSVPGNALRLGSGGAQNAAVQQRAQAAPLAPNNAARLGIDSGQNAAGDHRAEAAPVGPAAAPVQPLPALEFQRVFSAKGEQEDGYESDGERQDQLWEFQREMALRDKPKADPPAKLKMQPVEPRLVLPDPALDNSMLELGTIHLPIKAKAPYTVADLQERLVPTGLMGCSGDESYCRTRVVLPNIVYSSMLELLPVPQREHGCERTPMRVRRVIIVSCDGRARPLTVGISVHKEATLAELREAVAQHPAAACSPQEELVMGYTSGERDGAWFAKTHFVRNLSDTTNDWDARRGYVAYRIPRVACEEPRHPVRVVVFSKMPHTGRDNSDRDDSDEGESDEDDYRYFGDVDIAHTLLLDLPGDLWKGGPDADKQVAGAVVAALVAYRKPAAPDTPLEDCFNLDRCSSYGSTHGCYGHVTPFNQAVDDMKAVEWCTNSSKRDVLYLAAHWKPAGLDLYETESWSQPEVDASASKDAMAETEFLIREDRKAERARRLRARLPRTLLREVTRACKKYSMLGLETRVPEMFEDMTPIAAHKLAILPAEENSQNCATLAVQVFVWKQRGLHHRCFFQSAHDWMPPGKDKIVKDCKDTLAEVMQFLLNDDPLAQAMHEEVKACAAMMQKGRPWSVKGLMKWLEAGERPDAPQPPGLTVALHPYQRQSLRFMLDNERGHGGHRRHFWVPFRTPSGLSFWWSPIFQRACIKVAAGPWGGFLAEEMGCGKTVEILALILSNPAPPQVVSGTVTPDGYIHSRATLVVCAVSLVGQWMEEARSKLNGSLRMYQYHGQGRIKDAKKLATQYDLVVTTYQTMGSDWRLYTKKGGNTDGRFQPLGQINWHRVVLDESHTVKAGGAQQALACCALRADRRWCCSGTPISTDASEFYGQFNFLGCHPFNLNNFFKYHVKPSWASSYDSSLRGTLCLVYALGRTAIRHTQQQRLGGDIVCKLPEKTEETIAVQFTEAEQELYMRVHKEAKAEFERYALRGVEFVSRNLLAIMSLLSPLRAICSGGTLKEKDVKVPSWDREDEDMSPGVDPTLVAPAEECSICLNHDMERPCHTPCLHWFCRECITAELAVRDKCPLCRAQIEMAHLVEGVSAAHDPDGENVAGPANGAAPNVTVCESKLRVLLEELGKMRQSDPTAKALIFTQFNSTLEWLMGRLTQEGYGFRTISGSMPLKKRSQAIEAFQRDPPTTVFLLSMRSGAVGINLTAANHVFILEPPMNPALEDQAVGRAFRMGQQRPVTVKKLYIKGSVEERIMQLVKNRREGTATGAREVSYEEHIQKRKAPDVAGSINRDRQNLRLAELQLLFQDPVLPMAAGMEQAAAAYEAAPAPAACGGSG